MDKTQRVIATELLHAQGVALAHVEHELYLVAYKQADGLSSKEQRFLIKQQERVKEACVQVSKLTTRLRHNGRYTSK